MALGLKKSYSTFFLMNSKVDDGPIISKKFFLVKRNYYVQDLYDKTINIAEKQIQDICISLKKNKNLSTKKQIGMEKKIFQRWINRLENVCYYNK